MQELRSDKNKELLEISFISKALVKLLKQDIFNRYKQTGVVTDDDWEFCEKIDWHPVDELPLKEEFLKSIGEAKNEPSIRFNSLSEIEEK